tara:strand:+ start:421 stop:708 length:288 start_codon:yes stop_codon:yes gene_type:complete
MNVLIIVPICIGVFLYVKVMKYLKKKKVINKAIMNGINFFLAIAIGISIMHNVTIDIIDGVSIYIFNTLFSKLNAPQLPYQLAYYSSLTKKSVPI